jgi:hypothetical protein
LASAAPTRRSAGRRLSASVDGNSLRFNEAELTAWETPMLEKIPEQVLKELPHPTARHLPFR